MSLLLTGRTIFQATSEIVQLRKYNLGAVLGLFHTSTQDCSFRNGPRKFLQYNKTKFEPQGFDEEPRKAVNFIRFWL